MARYFLHVADGVNLARDDEGYELGSLADAVAVATASAREIMADNLRGNMPLGLHRKIVIEDEQGSALASVSFADALPPEMA